MNAIVLNQAERCAGNKKRHLIPLCFPHWLWIMHGSVCGREKLYQPNFELAVHARGAYVCVCLCVAGLAYIEIIIEVMMCR